MCAIFFLFSFAHPNAHAHTHTLVKARLHFFTRAIVSALRFCRYFVFFYSHSPSFAVWNVEYESFVCLIYFSHFFFQRFQIVMIVIRCLFSYYTSVIFCIYFLRCFSNATQHTIPLVCVCVIVCVKLQCYCFSYILVIC